MLQDPNVERYVKEQIKEALKPLKKKIKNLIKALENTQNSNHNSQKEYENKIISKEEYERLIEEDKIAQKEGDYSKMIMLGDEKWKLINAYKQEYICKHNHVTKSGYIETCSSCGKQW